MSTAPYSFARSPMYVLVIVLLLALPQLRAFSAQFEQGFRPFTSPPHRVTLSWDMFSIAIERCETGWNPPTQWNGRPLARLSDLGAPIEWDPVYNDHSEYLMAARAACGQAPAAGAAARTYHVRCFMAGGQEKTYDLPCP